MKKNTEIPEDLVYINKLLEKSNKYFLKVYWMFYLMGGIIILLYAGQLILRNVPHEFNPHDPVFYSPHRIVGLGISVVCILLSILVFMKLTRHKTYQESILGKTLVKLWFILSIILIINDTSNYIPFAYHYNVPFIYENFNQLIISMLLFNFMLLFSYYFTALKNFLYHLFFNLFLFCVFTTTIFILEDFPRTINIIIDFSLILAVINYFTIAAIMKKKLRYRIQVQPLTLHDIPDELQSKIRIGILTALLETDKDFSSLIEITGTTRGNLSIHMKKPRQRELHHDNEIIYKQ